jgi:hypothetical protein
MPMLPIFAAVLVVMAAAAVGCVFLFFAERVD